MRVAADKPGLVTGGGGWLASDLLRPSSLPNVFAAAGDAMIVGGHS